MHSKYTTRSRSCEAVSSTLALQGEWRFWARGYCEITVGLNDATTRDYIKTEEELEKQEEQMSFNH